MLTDRGAMPKCGLRDGHRAHGEFRSTDKENNTPKVGVVG